MRIKTITCHDVYNHGASLQAYALMKYLERQGHAVEIIDYKPDYLSTQYNLWWIPPHRRSRTPVVRLLYLVRKLPWRLLTMRDKRGFDAFKREYLHTTGRRYTTCAELKQDPPDADAYIAGSDHIWNTLFPIGRDPAFYLDFVPSGKKRIAYAASFSIPAVQPEYREMIKTWIEALDSISVREAQGLRILESLGIHRGRRVLDPVFLLDRGEWQGMAEGDFGEKYVLVYDFEKNPAIERFVKEVAARNRLKIYAVNHHRRTPYASRDFYRCGPTTFLGLVRQAEVVVSNSFHATVFALLFERPFYVFERVKYDLNSRMRDLLSLCGLDRRLIRGEAHVDPGDLHLEYDAVRRSMEGWVKESKQYLDEALSGPRPDR
jgi:hypothetical protein